MLRDDVPRGIWPDAGEIQERLWYTGWTSLAFLPPGVHAVLEVFGEAGRPISREDLTLRLGEKYQAPPALLPLISGLQCPPGTVLDLEAQRRGESLFSGSAFGPVRSLPHCYRGLRRLGVLSRYRLPGVPDGVYFGYHILCTWSFLDLAPSELRDLHASIDSIESNQTAHDLLGILFNPQAKLRCTNVTVTIAEVASKLGVDAESACRDLTVMVETFRCTVDRAIERLAPYEPVTVWVDWGLFDRTWVTVTVALPDR
jgi:hypothetical protein